MQQRLYEAFRNYDAPLACPIWQWLLGQFPDDTGETISTGIGTGWMIEFFLRPEPMKVTRRFFA